MVNIPFAVIDLGDMSEDARIALIGQKVHGGATVGFIVEDNDKADRYIDKLQKSYRVSIVSRGAGPIKGSILVKVGPVTN